jgi:alpha-glucuronidase
VTTPPPEIHPAWLPPQVFRHIGSRRCLVHGAGTLVETVFEEVAAACADHGGSAWRGRSPARQPPADLVFALREADRPGCARLRHEPAPAALSTADGAGAGAVEDESFTVSRDGAVTTVLAEHPAGLLHGLFHVVRLGESAFAGAWPATRQRPAAGRRMLDHWDNVAVDPVMGQVERGYAGGSLFWRDGAARDLGRVRAYARLLAACGVNAMTVNNVNVHRTEAHLLTDRLDEVAAIAAVLRRYGIRLHLSVSFAAPVTLGGLATADPADPRVRAWWAATTARVYQTIPDFGGYVVKADSEGQPGPFGYGRSHAEGANALAEALEHHGGVVHWRAFVYNHRQDWRDRSTDRARAAFDHFAPLDGEFRENVILQVKYGPIDFQVREPVSPVIAAMPGTRVAVELQVTQEYTGQQRHLCYLAPLWSEVLQFRPWGPGASTVAEVAAGRRPDPGAGEVAAGAGPVGGGGLVGVSNAGDDPYWTGHPLAQANLYAFGRLAWAPELTPGSVLDEWIGLTFDRPPGGVPARLRDTLHAMMDGSWRTYERYTAPLGVGFMVRPGHHYGPDVDGYEYTPWGTYHFADRDGVGVDRTSATGTGFTAQYPPPWCEVYEALDRCPDELLLFFHHVGYGHTLGNGSTVIQHIYDTHFAGVEEVVRMRGLWAGVADLVEPRLHARVGERLDEQVRGAGEWRDQINAYFHRKSGVPDARGRRIF